MTGKFHHRRRDAGTNSALAWAKKIKTGENRQSKLGKMKSVVVADPKTPPAAESVRKEADKLAQAVETAAEEVKPVAEAAPKKKRGFSPFKGFGKKKEA